MIKPIGIIAALFLPVSATAGTWAEFVAHCLDPYEVFSLPVTTLPEMEIDRPPEEFSAEAIYYGPTETGSIMVTDPVPAEGERACAMMGAVSDAEVYREWRSEQLTTGRYRKESSGTLLSTEWIEPKIRLRGDIAGPFAVYMVTETDLES
ncbi:MAG: hypothetical protein ACU0BB_03260 [Paracoccaceae bacterium]|jgi:hypothetical protein